jgi:hypothetical protein
MGQTFFLYWIIFFLAVLIVIGLVAFFILQKRNPGPEPKVYVRSERGNFPKSGYEDGSGMESPLSQGSQSPDLNKVLAALKEIRSLLEQNMVAVQQSAERNREIFHELIYELQRANSESRAVNDQAFNNVYDLFKGCISRLDDLNENFSLIPGQAGREMLTPYVSTEKKESVESLPSGRLRPIPALGSGTANFDQLISGNLDRITQASSSGRKDVELVVRQLAQNLPVELEVPSDHIFIIVSREAEISRGKAFVFPGSYLGRPWVDWFEMPSGVFERVESTITPATVSRPPFDNNWNLVQTGVVSQH